MSTGIKLYNDTCQKCSEIITRNYSTSFSLGIRTLSSRYHAPIYAIYGFVRYADEIVDSFHGFDKKKLLDRFREDTYTAIAEGISLNPVLHTFQAVVNHYHIERELIDAFLLSMEMDLDQVKYDQEGYEAYIYGSAEVVGLMCLHVFLDGNEAEYQRLKPSACSLGKAFQKVNFLRDLKSDFQERGRVYFPGVDFNHFDDQAKASIEADIRKDFAHAYTGIVTLPAGARSGVMLAYQYYLRLLHRITHVPAARIMEARIRVPDNQKLALWVKTYVRHQFNFV